MNKPGFSLIEVLAAMAVALILILGAAELVVFSGWAKRKGDEAAGLARAVETRLESLKSSSFESAELAPGEAETEVRDEASRILIRLEWTVEEAGEGLKRIRLAATPGGRASSRARLALLVSRDVGFRP